MPPASNPTLPQDARFPALRRQLLQWRARSYSYKPAAENQLAPVMASEELPLLRETVRMPWVVRFLPGYLLAQGNSLAKRGIFSLQRATFRFDAVRAYRQLFLGEVPDYVETYDDDEDFAWRRIAGPNPLSLRRAETLDELRARIAPSRRSEVEGRVRARLATASLEDEIAAGHVFYLDYRILHDALSPGAERADFIHRDTRWRRKYQPAPVVLFWENPDRATRRCDLVPLAIQVDQHDAKEPNRVWFPDDGMGWTIAKLYVETADQSFHAACGHVRRTHLTVDPFCMATYRNLARNHPLYVLLEPHLRFTLGTNKAAYNNFVDRTDAYFVFYSGTLEEQRNLVRLDGEAKAFWQLDLEEELADRGVSTQPADYPYRDDMRLYGGAIASFVREYVELYYESDAAVAADGELRAWTEELTDPARGAVRGLLPTGARHLERVDDLVRVLAQVIFIAGPGHASQHFAEMHYYRYPPAFAVSAYAPPPEDEDGDHAAHWRAMLPPIDAAALAYTYSQFGDFHFDRFGDYRRYRLGSVERSREAVRRFGETLAAIDAQIADRDGGRHRSCFFYRPSRVPNSINI